MMDDAMQQDPSLVPRLDMTVIEQVRHLEAVRPGLLPRLIEKFVEQTRALLEDAERDHAGISERMRLGFHSLKGTAASLGASRLSAYAGQAERAYAAGNMHPQLLQDLQGEFEQARLALLEQAGNG